jgi:hypothetical protein
MMLLTETVEDFKIKTFTIDSLLRMFWIRHWLLLLAVDRDYPLVLKLEKDSQKIIGKYEKLIHFIQAF